MVRNCMYNKRKELNALFPFTSWAYGLFHKWVTTDSTVYAVIEDQQGWIHLVHWDGVKFNTLPREIH